MAIAAVFVAPLPLIGGRWRMRYPRMALALWHGVLSAGLLAAVGSLVWSLTLAISLHRSALPATKWFDPTVMALFGWVGLAAIGGLFALVFSRAEPLLHTHRRSREEFDLLAATAAQRTVGIHGVQVVFIESELPFAVSFGGHDRRVLVTSRLEAELTAAEVRAVIEHERAHVVQRHGWVVQLAQLNRLCVPRLFGAREFERATHLLVELIADDTSARVCGARDVASSLAKLGALQGNESMMLRGRRIASHPPRLRERVRGAAGLPEEHTA